MIYISEKKNPNDISKESQDNMYSIIVGTL